MLQTNMKLVIFLALACLVNANQQDEQLIQLVKNARNFTGKVVLITGSSKGIGTDIAKLFSGLGAKVVLHGRKVNQLASAAEEVQALSPYKLKPLQVVADISNQTQIDYLLGETIKHYGQLDVLVNNAGMFRLSAVDSDHFKKDYDSQWAINMMAPLKLIRRAIPHLAKTKGNVISISSILTTSPQEHMMGFEVSKQALEMMSMILAQELGPKGIRLNVIRPGSTDSKKKNKISDTVLSHIPLGRNGQSADVAKGVVFLASPEAEFITGAVLNIDGGLSLGIGGNFMRHWNEQRMKSNLV